MSLAEQVTPHVTFLGSIAVFGLGTFLLAGVLAALFPAHVTAILVGWLLAAAVGARVLHQRTLGTGP